MKKTYFSALFVTLGCAVAIAMPSIATAQTSTLDKIKSSGQMTVAYRESSIPFSYLGADNKPTGFGWEICQRIVDEVKKVTGRTDLKVNTQPVTSQNRIPLMQNGTIDVECGSTTNNSDRQRQVAFAINYFYTGTRYLVKSDSGITALKDLKGRRVVSTAGTTNFQLMRKVSKDQDLDFDLMSAKDHADAMLMVQLGRADAFAMDDVLLFGLRAQAPNPAQFAVVGEALQVEPYAIMLRRDDPSFKQLVDDVVAGLMKSGEFDRLYKKWFETAIPPKGINLSAAMPKELKDNLKALSDKPAM